MVAHPNLPSGRAAPPGQALGAPPGPSALGDLARGPLPTADPGLVDQWREFLGRTEVRAALLQFGITMLQPNQPGETTLSRAGVAIGEAGGAVKRLRETEATREETTFQREQKERETAVSERQAGAAETRAGAAVAGVEVQAAGVKVSAEQVEVGRERNVQLNERARAEAELAEKELILKGFSIEADVFKTHMSIVLARYETAIENLIFIADDEARAAAAAKAESDREAGMTAAARAAQVFREGGVDPKSVFTQEELDALAQVGQDPSTVAQLSTAERRAAVRGARGAIDSLGGETAPAGTPLASTGPGGEQFPPSTSALIDRLKAVSVAPAPPRVGAPPAERGGDVKETLKRILPDDFAAITNAEWREIGRSNLILAAAVEKYGAEKVQEAVARAAPVPGTGPRTVSRTITP